MSVLGLAARLRAFAGLFARMRPPERRSLICETNVNTTRHDGDVDGWRAISQTHRKRERQLRPVPSSQPESTHYQKSANKAVVFVLKPNILHCAADRNEQGSLKLWARLRPSRLWGLNPFPDPGIPHGGPLGRRTRPAAAHAAPEVPW